jgi:hypothetical protein
VKTRNWEFVTSRIQFAIVGFVLAVIAAFAPQPSHSDQDAYEHIAREGVTSDCQDVHCFRILVPLVLGELPGPSRIKWKAYAVLVNAAAAVAVAAWCVGLGFSRREAATASWLTASGFGPLYTLFDCYTSDPLMFLLGPTLSLQLLLRRTAAATALATVGILAKEFAAAPLWISTFWAALEHEGDRTIRLLTISCS